MEKFFSALRCARAGGIRAGKIAPRRYLQYSDGTKTIDFPRNPYTGKNRLLAAIWEYYYQEHFYQRIMKGK